MTTLPLALLPRAAPLLAAWRRGEPAFFGAGVVLLALVAPLGAAALVDDRLLGGADIWLKPLKFALALGLYSLTLALYGHALPPGLRARRGYRAFRAAVIGAMLAEVAWVAGGAAAGTASHFNDRGWWAAIYPVMGVLATLLTSATAVFAVAVARNPRTGLPPTVKAGLVAGLALTLPLTLVTAGTLSANDGHLVGAAAAGRAVPFLGWSREAGDLRAPHFLATHAMHAVPLAGLVLAALGLGRRRALAWGFAAAWAALVAAAFAQALAGRPLLPL